MPDLTPPFEVRENTGIIDLLTAAGRYLIVIVTIIPALLALFKASDIAGIIDFLRGNQGAALLAAVTGFGTLAYGLIKTFRRGKQTRDIAEAAPNSVAKVV
jgi:hypothetical protein